MRIEKTWSLRVKSQTLLACTAVLLTTGCVTPMVETKRVVADSNSYLAESFTPAQLSPAVQTAVTKGVSLSPRFKTMRINFAVDMEDDGRKLEAAETRNLNNLGNGYVQVRSEFSRNAIAYRVNLELGFLGLQALKRQTVYLTRTHGEFAFEAKEIKRFDREIANPVKGRTYLFEIASGTGVQLANLIQEVKSCTVGEAYQASTLHPNFSGQAVSLECTLKGPSDVVYLRERYAYLLDYEVALLQESSGSRSKSVYKVVDAAITR